MNTYEAKEFVDHWFRKIEETKSISDLWELSNNSQIGRNVKYPEISFTISPEEIEYLKETGQLSKNGEPLSEYVARNNDPLLKLLYALVWKNGDTMKLKHIVNGISDSQKKTELPEQGIVFYQFGNHLANPGNEPIIDQHVIRAYAIYQSTDHVEIEHYRKLGIISANQRQLINNYRDWISSKMIIGKFGNTSKSLFIIDKILFSVGKRVKLKINN